MNENEYSLLTYGSNLQTFESLEELINFIINNEIYNKEFTVVKNNENININVEIDFEILNKIQDLTNSINENEWEIKCLNEEIENLEDDIEEFKIKIERLEDFLNE